MDWQKYKPAKDVAASFIYHCEIQARIGCPHVNENFWPDELREIRDIERLARKRQRD